MAENQGSSWWIGVERERFTQVASKKVAEHALLPSVADYLLSTEVALEAELHEGYVADPEGGE